MAEIGAFEPARQVVFAGRRLQRDHPLHQGVDPIGRGQRLFQQLLDPTSLVLRNRDGINIILLRLTDWQRFEQSASPTEAQQKIERNIRELAATLRAVAPTLSAPTLVCLCPAERKFVRPSRSTPRAAVATCLPRDLALGCSSTRIVRLEHY